MHMHRGIVSSKLQCIFIMSVFFSDGAHMKWMINVHVNYGWKLKEKERGDLPRLPENLKKCNEPRPLRLQIFLSCKNLFHLFFFFFLLKNERKKIAIVAFICKKKILQQAIITNVEWQECKEFTCGLDLGSKLVSDARYLIITWARFAQICALSY